MALSRARVASIAGLALVIVIPLIPDSPAPVRRNAEQDVSLVRAAEVQYRGITASFDELSRAYAITAYEDAEWVAWSARPNPMSPQTEALVTCRFRVGSARPDSLAGAPGVTGLRDRPDGELEVTWRLSTLAAVQVQAHDDYAHDALDVYRHTVDRSLERLAYLPRALALRDAPGGTAGTVLDVGTVVLVEDRRDGWARVRIPADTTTGWVPAEHLRAVRAGGE